MEYHFNPYDCNWLPLNGFLFQLANLMLCLTYVVPDTLNGLFMLRFFLGSAGLFFSLWAWWNICAPDTLAWNVVFMIGNFVHALYMFIRIKRPRKFLEHVETVYEKFFQPMGIQRFQFQVLASNCSVRTLKDGEVYGDIGKKAERISILLQGRVEVKNENCAVHVTKPYEFLDSPEWASSEQDDLAEFGVTLVAQGDILFVEWKCEVLNKLLKKDKFLRTVFNSIICQDVTKKLMSLTKRTGLSHDPVGSVLYLHQVHIEKSASPSNGHVVSRRSNAMQDTDSLFENNLTPSAQVHDNTPLLRQSLAEYTSIGVGIHKAVKLFSTPHHEEIPLIDDFIESKLDSDIGTDTDRETVI